MDKKQFWPKEGKLKKGLIILVIVIAGVFLITFIEEKTKIPMSNRIPMVIAFACLGVWFYNPKREKENTKN